MFHSKKKLVFVFTALVILTVASINIILGKALSTNNENIYNSVDEQSIVNLDISSNRFTIPETLTQNVQALTLDGFDKKIDNGGFEIWVREQNSSIRIVDKATGYVWGCIEKAKADDLNTIWSDFANSPVIVEVFDSKAKLISSSYSSDECKRSYTILENSIIFNADFEKYGLSFSFTITLNDDGISVSLDRGSIVESSNFKLSSVTFLPFLGSTRENETNGYFFLPDGSGALMRFRSKSTYLNNYEKRVYGNDYGIDDLSVQTDLHARRPNEFMMQEPQILMPVFGIVHGENKNAFLSEIISGSEYSTLMANPANQLLSYNYVRVKFVYRQVYLQPTKRSGGGVRLAQGEPNEFNAELRYYFLKDDKASYFGMAEKYRELLTDRGILKKSSLQGSDDDSSDIKIQIDVICSVLNKGFLFNSPISASKAGDISDMSDELKQRGINNILFVAKGWQKGGIGGAKLNELSVDKDFGTLDSVKKLNDTLLSGGNSLLLYLNPVSFNAEQISSSDIGFQLSQTPIKLTKQFYNNMFPDEYFLKAQLSHEFIIHAYNTLTGSGFNHFAIDEYGYRLYSEQMRNKEVTRSEALAAHMETTSEIKNSSYYMPNSFLWEYTDYAFNMPMLCTQYLFVTDTVPFLQIVLKGSIEYFAPYVNESAYSQTDILRMIEYGAYPSFLITEAENYKLSNTVLYNVYSTQFDNWKDNIVSVYSEIDLVLSQVKGAVITGRKIPQKGLSAVSYDNGKTIVVNYNSESAEYLGHEIKPQSFLIISQ